METVRGFAKLTVTNSQIKNSDKNKFQKKGAKKNLSNFQSVKYLNRIAAAKSQQQVRSIISSLTREISNAKNCENCDRVIANIYKVKSKAEIKIQKLASERATEKKRERLKLEHKKKEKKRQDRILNVKRRSRKIQESFDIYEGAKDDAEMLKTQGIDSYDNTCGESLIGKNLDNVADSSTGSNQEDSTVDVVI